MLSNGTLSATVKADGAELCSLCNAAGEEMLWQAAPIWPRHAPVLFPDRRPPEGRYIAACGQDVSADTTRVCSRQTIRLAEPHGVWLPFGAARGRRDARDLPLRVPARSRVQLDDDTLEQSFTIFNPSRNPLPASLGAHPAFIWPLAEGIAKSSHTMEFAQPEMGPVRRLDQGLLRSEPETCRIGGTLHLEPTLFAKDALILSDPVSHSVRYSAPGTATIEVGWQGFTQLGIWSREGGDFLCIEPWHGTPARSISTANSLTSQD